MYELLGTGSHTRGVYSSKDTSRMRTARVKQEEKSRHKNNNEKYERYADTIIGKVPNKA